MALKDAWKALIGKSDTNELSPKEETAFDIVNWDLFSVVQAPEINMSRYKQIPLSGIAALGAAFSQLPEVARTIVQTTTSSIATDKPLFVGINPNGIKGFLTFDEYGTTGNIMQINEQGKHVIAGRMRFQAINGGLPVTETVATTIPFDPTLMVVAVALMTIEKKLDGIQESVEEILQFLKFEKQSRQRGNLNMLAEIMEECKQNCNNEKLCALRNNEVQSIKREAHQDILFYQKKIAENLQKQRALHGSREAQSLLNSVMYEFAEYQLACYIYSFSSFLDVMLQKSFDSSVLDIKIKKMSDLAKSYHDLYADCHSKIAKYHRTAIEAQLVGGVGIAAKNIGKAIASIPILKEGPVDEALISAAESVGKFNRENVQKKLQLFESFENNQMDPFIENLCSVNSLYNGSNALLTDGDNLYVPQLK